MKTSSITPKTGATPHPTQTPNIIIGNPGTRRIVYKVTALLGLAIGATQVGFLAGQAGQPLWLTVTVSVYGFLAAGIGFTSASNTPKVGAP